MLTADPGIDPRLLTLRQRADDLHQRSMLGGVFYLLSWLLVAGFGDGWRNYPLAASLIAIVLLVLLASRIAIRRWARRQPEAAARTMRWQWGVLLFTAALWGALACWALLDAAFQSVRTITLVSSVSLATAFAQIFAMNKRLALLGTTLLYLPLLGVVAREAGQLGLAMVLCLNAVYLVAVIGRSHREYEDKLALDELLRLQRDRFAQQSRIDALTGLANRGYFQECLDAAIVDARKDDSQLVLLIADLDHFKSINDRHGHAGGDHCLRAVAALLKESFAGQGVLVARLGGEEFGVLAQASSPDEIMLLAETFRARLARLRMEFGSASFAITASLGLARYNEQWHAGGDALYAAADEALYRAKSAGRNRLEAA